MMIESFLHTMDDSQEISHYAHELPSGTTLDEKMMELDSVVIEIAKDGHCLLNAISECLQRNYKLPVSTTELFETLKCELLTNTSEYGNFLVFPNCKPDSYSLQLETELDRLFTHGVYNNDNVDVVIPALCNSLQMTVIILQKGTDGKLIEIRQTPSRLGEDSKYLVYLLRVYASNGAEHYNAVVRSSVNKLPTKPARKRKVYVQSFISDMFSSKQQKTSGTGPGLGSVSESTSLQSNLVIPDESLSRSTCASSNSHCTAEYSSKLTSVPLRCPDESSSTCQESTHEGSTRLISHFA